MCLSVPFPLYTLSFCYSSSNCPSLFFTSPFYFFLSLLPSFLPPCTCCQSPRSSSLESLLPVSAYNCSTQHVAAWVRRSCCWRERIIGRAVDCLKWKKTEGRKRGEKVERQCGPHRGRTKTGENSRNEEVEMRKRQRMHGRRGNSRRKTGSNLITASFHSSPLSLLIVSQFPASVSFSITYRIFCFSGFPFSLHLSQVLPQ